MIVRLRGPSPNLSSHFWLPVYLYNEPPFLRSLISICELILYIFTAYVVSVNLRIYLKIRMFHRNFLIISTPMFGLWYELIIGKLITMAYQLNLIRINFEDREFMTIWTDNEAKMLIVDKLEGLEMLLVAGFIEWHYMFSVLFGMVSCVLERGIASMLIDNYETNTNLWIPTVLTLFVQLSAVSFALLLFTFRSGFFSANLSWFLISVFSSAMFLSIKRLNERWQRRMEDPRRKVVFSVSQRFQVKENLRAVALATWLIIAVLAVTVTYGVSLVAQIVYFVPPFLCHFTENCLFLNPLLVCFANMYSLPAWKQEFRKALPSFRLKTKPSRIGVISVEPMEDFQKKLSIETDIYFEQLNKSWI